MHNTPEQNAAFRAAFDATNARWKAQQAAHEAQQQQGQNMTTATSTKRTPKPKSAIIYSGPSLIDGAPIICVAIVTSGNVKTGNMIQTHILRADIDPLQASKTGADYSICGNCKHRGTATSDSTRKQAQGRTCYVNLAQGPTVVFKGYKRGIYSTATPEQVQAIGRGRMVRLGTYGDPAAVPAAIWDNLLKEAAGHTGYTHQHNPAYISADYSRMMYSADTQEEAQEAHRKGYRTFRVIPVNQWQENGSASLLKSEIICPASKEAGQRVTCEKCKLCEGSQKAGKSIAIVAHGTGRASVTDTRTARKGV